MGKKTRKETWDGDTYWEDESGNREYEKKTWGGNTYIECDSEDPSGSGSSSGGGGGGLVGLMLMVAVIMAIGKGITNVAESSASAIGTIMTNIGTGLEDVVENPDLQRVSFGEIPEISFSPKMEDDKEVSYVLDGKLISGNVGLRPSDFRLLNAMVPYRGGQNNYKLPDFKSYILKNIKNKGLYRRR